MIIFFVFKTRIAVFQIIEVKTLKTRLLTERSSMYFNQFSCECEVNGYQAHKMEKTN